MRTSNEAGKTTISNSCQLNLYYLYYLNSEGLTKKGFVWCSTNGTSARDVDDAIHAQDSEICKSHLWARHAARGVLDEVSRGA